VAGVAIDTNILVYAEGVDDPGRQARAIEAIERERPADIVLPLQVLGELFTVLCRKGSRTPLEARRAVLTWAEGYRVMPTDAATIVDAMDLVAAHRVAFWDAVILSAAAEAGCRTIMSEDMQDGFTWRGVTVRNPFT
jgi:predicted nucleic acid-binding protein